MRSLVAVVGVGAVLPDARTADDFWENLVAGRAALRLPRGEIGFDTHYDICANSGVGRLTFKGGWIADSWQFDWRRYRVPPADAAIGNRMQFATLEAGTQALAGVKNLPCSRTAIILGASGLGFQKDGGLRVRSGDLLDELRAGQAWNRLDAAARERVLVEVTRAFTARLKECSSDDTVGSLASVAAARIAMHHDLYGPHYAVDADHASALAALEIAVDGLQEGEWDCALAGGVSELLTPTELAAYGAFGALSPSGRLRPFAGDADGTLLGEGAALVALKRLDDARRDGDRVLAVVRAIGRAAPPPGRASSGSGADALAPDAGVIAAAIGEAWRAAERSPSAARLFECDAGGVLAGDAAEAAALRAVLDGDASTAASAPPIALGAVKARIGHLRAAAGAAGLVSTVLSLHHRRLVPSIDGSDAPRDLDPRLCVIDGAVELGGAAPLTAGVTAIALDGQTFHVVLESAPPPSAERAASAAAPPPFRFAPLAVTGMAGTFAGAPDLERFWESLAEGRDAVVDVPPSRWPLERYYSADGKERNKSSARMGSFIELPLSSDDEERDPTQLLIARVAAEAWRDAGAPSCDPARARVFIGFMPFVGKRWLAEARVNFRELAAALAETLEAQRVPGDLAAQIVEETERRYTATLPPLGRGSLPGWLGSMAAAAVARQLALGGGHVAIESACASTLAALHAAAQALHLGRCDVAVVGGAWCDIAPEFYVATSRFNALSPGGIAPFAAGAAGFVPGEGAGVLVLERADDARKKGRRVRALVRSCAGSSDGKGRSVLTPSVEGESLALQRALEAAGLDGTDVDYVECHGTGTALGDAVEAMALACSYGGAARRAPLRIGSVKSNLGHLIAAAGAPALQKVVLALEHELVPPSLHCERPNPKIEFAASGLELVRAATPWPRGPAPRRAGVSAFGIGGSNFHAIVEEPDAATASESKLTTVPDVKSEAGAEARAAAQLFAFVGGDVEGCVDELTALAAMLDEAAPDDFADAARSSREQAAAAAPTSVARLALTAASSHELEHRAEALAGARAAGRALSTLEPLGVFVAAPPIAGERALLFPGQGSQYAGMLRELAGELPVVAQLVDRADAAWRALTSRPLRPTLWPDGDDAETSHEDLHAAVFTVNCALHAALGQLGVRGDVYIGQSAGELAALVAAGMLGFEDGLRAMHARTRAVLELPLADAGRMAAVACGADQLRALVATADGIAVVAADNCPTSSLASGGTSAMTSLAARCAVEGIDCVPLAVSHAYHSPIIAAAATRYRQTLEALTWSAPRATVISTVDLAIYDDDVEATIARLVRQYTTPVRFTEAIELAWERGVRLFFEAGPKWPLTSYVRQILDGRTFVAQAAMHPKVGERQQLLRLSACAFVHGAGALSPAEEADVTTTNPKMKPIPATAATTAPPTDETFERVRARMIAALAERTGYPEEMLDLDLDLEGDLGIDTVKQVEVFARVRDELGLVREEGVSLRQLNTLRKVIGRLAGRLSGVATETATAPASRFEAVRERVIAALIERTGYPAEMLELDLDLEGDLGIDTVKQVEVFARVRDELGLLREEGVSLRQFNTLRKVIERLAARLEGAPAITAPPLAPAATVPTPSATPAPRATPTPTPNATPPTPASSAHHYPLVGRVVEQSASRVVVERLFAATTDYYLQDSRVAGRACVPAAIAWEALAEAAELILGAPVTAAGALQSAGPLFLDGDGRTQVRVEAERAADGRVHATLFVREEGGAPKVRCGAEFSAAVAAPIAVPRDVGRALDRRGQSRNGHAVTGADSGVQLGETLGGCVWARSLSFCELVGGIRADSEKLFEAVTAPRFVLAPAVLECAFMLAGFGWYALTRQSGIPVEVERITVGRAPELDEEVLCHVRLRQGNGDAVTCDLLLLGADRAPLCELRGLKLMPVDRVVDMAADAPDALSWTRFCQALQDRNGGSH